MGTQIRHVQGGGGALWRAFLDDADLDALAEEVIASGDVRSAFEISRCVEGAPVERLGRFVAAQNDPRSAFVFAKEIAGAPLEELARCVARSGDARLIAAFVNEVPDSPCYDLAWGLCDAEECDAMFALQVLRHVHVEGVLDTKLCAALLALARIYNDVAILEFCPEDASTLWLELCGSISRCTPEARARAAAELAGSRFVQDLGLRALPVKMDAHFLTPNAEARIERLLKSELDAAELENYKLMAPRFLGTVGDLMSSARKHAALDR